MFFFTTLSTDVSTLSETSITQEVETPLVVFTCIATVPSDTPVTIPAPSTVAISVLPDIHSILSVVFCGVTVGYKRNVSPVLRL